MGRKKDGNRKLIRFRIGILVLSLALLSIGVFTVDKYVQNRFNALKGEIFRSLEQRYQIRISYRDISPSILSSFRIRKIVLSSVSLINPWDLECDSLRLVLNPLALFRSDFQEHPESLVQKVVVRKGRLVLRPVTGNSDTSVDFPDLLNSLKFPHFDVSVKNFDVIVSGDAINGSLTINRLNLRSGREQVRMNGRWAGSFRFFTGSPAIREFSFANSITGVASHNGTFFDMDARFTDLETDSFNLQPLKLNLSLRERELKIRKIEDDQPYDLTMSYLLDGENLSVRFFSEKWKPGELIDFSRGKDPGIGDFLGSEISCTAELNTREGLKRPVYAFDGTIRLKHPLIKGNALLTTRLSGDSEMMDFQKLLLNTDWGSADFQGVFSLVELAPKGRMELRNIETPFDYNINSVLDLSYRENVILVDSIVFSAGKMKVEDIRLIIQKGTGDLYSTLLFDFGEGEKLTGSISKRVKDNRFYGWQFQVGAVDVGADKLAALLSLGDDISLAGAEYAVNMLAEGLLTEGGRINARLNQINIASRSDPLKGFSAQGSVSQNGFELNDIVLTTANGDLTGYSRGTFDDKGFRSQSLFYYNEIPYGFSGTYRGGKSFLIQGDHGLSGMITGSGKGQYFFHFDIDEFPIPLEEGEIDLSCQVTGYYRGNKDWQFLVKQGEWHLKKSLVGQGSRFLTTFRVSPELIDLYSLSYSDRYSHVRGYGQFRINSWQERNFLGWFRAQDADKGELYRGYFLSSENRLNGQFTVNRFPLARIDQLMMTGYAGATVQIDGDWDSPRFQGSISTREMKFRGQKGMAKCRFDLAPDTIQLSGIDLDLGPLFVDKGLIQLDRKSGELTGSGGLGYNHYDSRLEGRFAASFQLQDLKPNSFSLPDNFNGKIYLSELFYEGQRAFPAQYFSIVSDPAFLSVKENGSNSADFFYNRKNRSYDFFMGAPWPINFHSTGRVSGGHIDATVNNIVFHMDSLNYVMVKDLYLKDYFVVFKGGTARGDLVILGDFADPLFFGTLEVTDLLADTPFTYSKIDKTMITAQFKEKELVIEPFSLAIGDGLLEAEALFQLEHWLPVNFEIQTRARQRKGKGGGVQAYYPLPYIDFDGVFTGDVMITGDRSGAHFAGELLFHKLEVTPGALIEPLVSDQDQYPYRITTDLKFITGKDVVFYLPDKKNRIVEAVVNPDEFLIMQADTLSQILIMNGTLTLKAGEINYFGKTFNLTEGSMVFNEDQNKFDPYLSVEAEIRTHDSDGEETIISMIYDAPLSVLLTSFEPRFSSIPSKSQNEILTMLGQSFIPYDDQDEDWGAVPIRIAGDYLLEPNVIRPVEDILKDSLGLDMISIRTNIVENAILERIFFNEYYLNTDYDFSLGRYLDDTSFYMGQYLGSNLFLSGSLQFKYSEDSQENPLLDSLNLQTIFNFGLELKTPLLTISWNYSPGLSGENFVADNQITLKWKYQF